MIGLSTERSPSERVVVPHFIAAAIAFLVLAILVLISSDNLIIGFYSPKVLAITHITALSWGTMIIIGSLYQLIPVVFETKLYSEKLAIFNFWLFVISISLFSYSFWYSKLLQLMPYTSILIFVSVWLFAINIIKSYQTANKKDISARFIITAIFWLMMTSLFGLLMAYNYKYNFLDSTNFRYLKIHAHFGMIGWFLQLIMGVAITLVPMFLVSHKLDDKKLIRTYWLLNSGLVLLYLDWQFFNGSKFLPVFWILILTSIVQYISYIYDSYKNKLRKLDIGMKHTMLAFVIILLPVIFSALILFFMNSQIHLLKNIVLIYGFSIFFGFYTNMILGQTYKTIPFIIWLHRYQKYVGKAKTPFPRELYNEKLANIQFYIYNIMLFVLLLGLILSNIYFVKAGAVLMIITSIIYNFNMFKIIFGKKEIVLNK
ncbi:MAG TPA: hypothetical protein ENK91_04030 [Bacteroidetes bacterium]|nr:hypothetical protein [Bacteroidota bacterium]